MRNNVFIKVHDNAVSVVAGLHGKVVEEKPDWYRVICVNSAGCYLPPIWVKIEDCDIVSAKTEIEIIEKEIK
jgi:hypothetical protein